MRYDIQEKAAMPSGTRVFHVIPTRAVSGPGAPIEVWYSSRPNCTQCSGPLTAMSSSCAHSAAVRRHIKKQSST